VREQLVGFRQHQRVRPSLPPGLVPHLQRCRVDLGVDVSAAGSYSAALVGVWAAWSTWDHLSGVSA
jgi:hypothetical protein